MYSIFSVVLGQYGALQKLLLKWLRGVQVEGPVSAPSSLWSWCGVEGNPNLFHALVRGCRNAKGTQGLESVCSLDEKVAFIRDLTTRGYSGATGSRGMRMAAERIRQVLVGH